MARHFLVLVFSFLAVTCLCFAAESPISEPNGDNSTPVASTGSSSSSSGGSPTSSVTAPFAAMDPGTDLMSDIAPSEDDTPVDDEAGALAPTGTPIVVNAVPAESGDSSGNGATGEDQKNAAPSTYGMVSFAATASAAAVAGYFVF